MSSEQDRCPRCRQLNQCALATAGGSCWCFSERAGALATTSGQACLCRSCLTEAAALQSRTLQWQHGALSLPLGLDEAGAGASVVLLPALSSISTRDEMRALLLRLATTFRVRALDWPGFGELARPRVDWSPSQLSAFLEWALGDAFAGPHSVIAAGHAAAYALRLCQTRPGVIRRLILVAPTWRGPLPTMMGGQRPWFARLRATLDHPLLGPPLYRLNVSRPIVSRMAREHVYEAASWLQGARLDAKLAITRASGARHASVRFVSGALDLVDSRDAFLKLARGAGVPILQIYGEQTPRRSRSEMEALGQLPDVRSVRLAHGRLAVHEEFPDAVANAALPFLQESEAGQPAI